MLVLVPSDLAEMEGESDGADGVAGGLGGNPGGLVGVDDDVFTSRAAR